MTTKSSRFPQMALTKRNRELSPSKGVMYSPFAVEQDQKDIIIQKLKEEINMLDKNRAQLSILKDHYRKLQHQYNTLQNQKKANDNAFAKHHEAALKEICLMKNEIDSIKAQARDKKSELQDYTADKNTFNSSVDEKQIKVEQLKSQLRSSFADNEELALQKQKLLEIHRSVSQQRQMRAEECQKMNIEIDRVSHKIQELTKYHATLQIEYKALNDQILKLQEINNNDLDEIEETTKDISIINDEINKSTSIIADLQKKTIQANGMSEKFKNDSLFAKKSHQSEVMKNNALSKNIQEAEGILVVRKNQVKQGLSQLDMLNRENFSLQKINTQLEDDLEACRRHLQNLSLLNNDLVRHMQTITEQDEEVRALIDRRDRIQRAEMNVRQREELRRSFRKLEEQTISSSRFKGYSRRVYN